MHAARHVLLWHAAAHENIFQLVLLLQNNMWCVFNESGHVFVCEYVPKNNSKLQNKRNEHGMTRGAAGWQKAFVFFQGNAITNSMSTHMLAALGNCKSKKCATKSIRTPNGAAAIIMPLANNN